jgi:hypothetical protein
VKLLLKRNKKYMYNFMPTNSTALIKWTNSLTNENTKTVLRREKQLQNSISIRNEIHNYKTLTRKIIGMDDFTAIFLEHLRMK